MNEKDKAVLIRCIKKESLDYGMICYSSYDENSPEFNRVEDEKFHKLRKMVRLHHDDKKEDHEMHWSDLKTYLLKEIPELEGWCEVPEYKFDHDAYSDKYGYDAWERKVFGIKHAEENAAAFAS